MGQLWAHGSPLLQKATRPAGPTPQSHSTSAGPRLTGGVGSKRGRACGSASDTWARACCHRGQGSSEVAAQLEQGGSSPGTRRSPLPAVRSFWGCESSCHSHPALFSFAVGNFGLIIEVK